MGKGVMMATLKERIQAVTSALLLSDVLENECVLNAVSLLQEIAEKDTVCPKVCDGKEQEAFEQWASTAKYDMSQHPLFYLFLTEKTNAARQGWKAAIEYCSTVTANTTLLNADSIQTLPEKDCPQEAIERAKQFTKAFPSLVEKESLLRGWFTNLMTDMVDQLRHEHVELAANAARWQTIVALMGHWQDGSDETVTLFQDDATRTAILTVGNGANMRRFYREGYGIDAALAEAFKYISEEKSNAPRLE